jgi:phosphate transport system substrate-binding protein
MRHPSGARLLAAACFLAVCSSLVPLRAQGAAGSSAKPFSIAGSGSNIPLTQRLLDAFGKRRGQALAIPPSIGTAGAIKALQAGELDIGLISRPLKEAERGSGLRQAAYARMGIVLGVNPSVPDTSISPAELVSVYNGTKSAWRNGATIIVLAREAGDSSNAILEKAVPGFAKALADSLAKKRWEVFYTDAEENEAIATMRNSLGLTDTVAVALSGGSIKALRLDGVEPSPKAVADGTYPLRKELFFAYREPLSVEARSFIDFVSSAEGAKIIFGAGALPATKD